MVFLELMCGNPSDRVRWLVVSCGLALAGLCFGHHDPATEAALLTAKMHAEGLKAELLCARAQLWRTLRKQDLAIADYEQAVSLEPDSAAIRWQLAQAYYAADQLKPAFSEVERALKESKDGGEKASLLMLRASIHLEWKFYEKAVQDCQSAFVALPSHGKIEWYLRRSYAQRMAGRFDACVEGLREGYVTTGSAVLYAQWVDALIDAKVVDEAMTEIDSQLEGLRYSASWRVRRARALLGLNREAEARRELTQALEELNERLGEDTAYPDITLLSDRGLAHLLLGDQKAAREDYERATAAGAVGWMHWRLMQAFSP